MGQLSVNIALGRNNILSRYLQNLGQIIHKKLITPSYFCTMPFNKNNYNSKKENLYDDEHRLKPLF